MVMEMGGRCECCGEDAYEFLSIDHTNGLEGRGRAVGRALYAEIRAEPERFRLLCFNCHYARTHHGFCPHEKA